MKKTNILTSILNIIIQIAYLIWAFVYYDTDVYSAIMSILNISFFAMCLFMGQAIVMSIINLVVGIKNRKKSITSLVIYIIIAVLFIIQILFFYLTEELYEDWCGIVFITSYFLICALDIFTFIWTLIKVPKSEKKTKYDTIIFIIVIITVILCLTIPQIWFLSITKKFEEAATDELNETHYMIVEDKNTYSFMNEKGEIEFSINASSCAIEETVYVFDNGKKLKFINILDDDGLVKAIDINDPNNLKEIYSCKCLSGHLSRYLFNELVKADIASDYYNPQEEKIADNNLHKDEEVIKYKKYEESADYIYTYYSNSNITVQVAEPKENIGLRIDNGELTGQKIDNEEVNEEVNEEEPLQREIYLINNKDDNRIKLDCEDLMYRFDEETGEKYINLYDDKYIAFLNKDKNTNGYFNLQGEKMTELLNNYVLLDISENCSLVAKVTDVNKTLAKEYNDDYDYGDDYYYYDNHHYGYDFENLQLMLINNNSQIISDVYSDGKILDNFYILDSTLWNKNGKKLAKDIYEFAGILDDGAMVIVEENYNRDYQIWDTNHQVASYDRIEMNIYHSSSYENMHEKEITDVYTQALSQM